MPDLVYVGCRLPHGLHLDVGQGEAVKRVTIAGANRARLIGGAGVTPVPKDHWDAWHAKNKDLAFMKSGAVFVTKSPADAEMEGEQRKSDKTGFEGADPAQVDRKLKELER